jgi:hypothetical protein
MVVVSAFAQIPWTLWWSRSVWLHAGSFAWSSARLWLPNYVWALIVIAGMPACTLLGGLWAADSRLPQMKTEP